MNDEREIIADPGADPLVSNTYRMSATETAPEHLNKAILKAAGRVADGGIFKIRLPGWVAVFALVSTVVLSLTFVSQFASMDILQSPKRASGGVQNAPADTIRQPGGDLAAAVESTGIRLRELDSAAEKLLPTNKPVSGATTDAASTARPFNIDTDANRACNDATMASADSWWSCIEGLQKKGQLDAARAELDRLRAAFPEFQPTE